MTLPVAKIQVTNKMAFKIFMHMYDEVQVKNKQTKKKSYPLCVRGPKILNLICHSAINIALCTRSTRNMNDAAAAS